MHDRFECISVLKFLNPRIADPLEEIMCGTSISWKIERFVRKNHAGSTLDNGNNQLCCVGGQVRSNFVSLIEKETLWSSQSNKNRFRFRSPVSEVRRTH